MFLPCVTASRHVRVMLDSFSLALEPSKKETQKLKEKSKSKSKPNQSINHKSSANHSKKPKHGGKKFKKLKRKIFFFFKKELKPHSHYIWSLLSLNIIPLGSHGWDQGSTRHSWIGKSISWAALSNSFLLLTRMFKREEKELWSP